VEDSYTFDNLQNWIDDASNHITELDAFEWALIGNKCDLQNEVERSRVDSYCKKLEAKLFYLVSAKTGDRVMEAFKSLIITIHKKRMKQPTTPTQQQKNSVRIDSTTIESGDKQKTRGSCC